MSSDTLDLTEQFSRGTGVHVQEPGGEFLQDLEVYTSTSDHLDFLLNPEEPVYNRIKFSNRFRLENEGGTVLSGRLHHVEHRPSYYERVTDLETPDPGSSSRLVRFTPDGAQSSLNDESHLGSWFEILHLRSLPTTVIPILLGFVYAAWMNWSVSPLGCLMALLGGTFLHLASNLHNEISDYHFTLDNGNWLDDNSINRRGMNPSGIWGVAVALYSLAVLCGLPLLYWWGTDLLVVGALGFLIASFYSYHQHMDSRYPVVRDLLMTLLLGPLMSVAASIAASGLWDWNLCLVSAPVGVFVAVILHENELYNLPIDRRAGATTLAILLGFKGSKQYYISLIVAGYVAIGALVVLGVTTPWSLLTYLSIPFAIHNFRVMSRAKSPLHPELLRLRFSTVVLQILFGVTYVVGFLAEIYLTP